MKKTSAIISIFVLVSCLAGAVYIYAYPFKIKNYRILACISSYNRPVFVSGQVLRLLEQSYPVDISVSLKGIPHDFVIEALKKEWASEIASGRVIVREDPNRDQYSNLLDTVRDIDLSKYDFFCKIDDDDWYGPDYFKNVNKWLNRENGLSLSYTKNNMIISQEDENTVLVFENSHELFGPSMCFSRKLIELALWLEKHPKEAETYVSGYPLSKFRKNKEDNFLHKLSLETGRVQKRESSVWDLTFGWMYKSVTR